VKVDSHVDITVVHHSENDDSILRHALELHSVPVCRIWVLDGIVICMYIGVSDLWHLGGLGVNFGPPSAHFTNFCGITIITYCTGGVPGTTFKGLGPRTPCQKSPKNTTNDYSFHFAAFL